MSMTQKSVSAPAKTAGILGDNHLVVIGKTGVGKSRLAEHLVRAIAPSADEAFTLLDPKGDTARAIAEWLANPLNGCSHRTIHVLNGGSTQHTFGLNPLQTEEATPQAWHDAATILTTAIASYFHTAIQETPHLERIVQCAGALLAEKGLTIYELPALLTLGAEQLREHVLSNSQNPIYAAEIADLGGIAKNPARFLEVCQSTKNRFVSKVGNPALARIFSQRHGLNARAVMEDGDLVLVDTSALRPNDAAFVNTIITSSYVAAAFRRTPNTGRMHRLFLEEATDMLVDETARALDGTRKFRLTIAAFLQRIAQAKEKGEFVFDALMVNTIKVVFALPEPDSADYLARLLFGSVLNLAEWKPGTERPVAVGHDKVVLRSSSRARHNAEAEASSLTDMRSFGTAFASMSADMSAWGGGSSSSRSDSAHGTPGVVGLAPVNSASHGDSFGRHAMASSGRSVARSSAQQASRGRASTNSRATVQGNSSASGESEAFITRYEWLPSQCYTLQEQLFRYATLLMELPRRHCIVKLEGQPPYLSRTADLSPAFADQNFKRAILPQFLELAARTSPYIAPIAQIDAEIAARQKNLSQPPHEDDHDFGNADTPIVNDPDTYAAGFWDRLKTKSIGSASEPPPRGSKPRLIVDNAQSELRDGDGDNAS